MVDLSEPYLTTPVGVVGRPGTDVPDLATARSLRWAVAESTTEVDVVDDQIRPDDPAEILPTTSDALAAVADRRVDLAALDYVHAWAEVAADDRLAVVAQITAPQHYGALLPKGSPNLGPVDAALRRLENDGTLRRLEDELYDRYDVDIDRVPTIRVSP